MKLYRGYNSQYNNYGIPSGSNHIWTTDDINYANEYYDSVVEFEIDENELNVADIYDLWEVLGDEEGEFDPIDLDNEEAQALIDNNYNCLIFDTPSDETVYVLLDKKLIKSVRNINNVIQEAGYSGWSKSNNAIEAESENKFPASIAAKKLGVSTEAIRVYIPTSEWHHYSSYYNEVKVYDITPYLMLKNNDAEINELYDSDEIEEFKAIYKLMKEFTKQEKVNKDGKKYKANVEYIEWSGTRSHPKANIKQYNNITVIEKGQFYTFILPDKTEVRKKIGSNGTKVISVDEAKKRVQKEKEELKLMKQRFAEFKKNTSAKALKFLRNNIETNSDGTHLYIKGRKPSQYDYDNLSKFFQKGEKRLTSKHPYMLSTNGVYLEQWDGEKWIPMEDNTLSETGEHLPFYYVKQFIEKNKMTENKRDKFDNVIQEILRIAGVKELNESYMKTDKGIIYYTKSENVFLNTLNARFKNIPVRVIYDLKNGLYIFGDANTFVHTQMMNYILVNTKIYSTKGWNQSYFNEDGNYWRDGYIEDNLFKLQCALFQIIWDNDIEKYTRYDGYDTGYFTTIDNKMYVVCRENELKYCEKVPLLWNNHWFSQKYDNMKDFQLNEEIVHSEMAIDPEFGDEYMKIILKNPTRQELYKEGMTFCRVLEDNKGNFYFADAVLYVHWEMEEELSSYGAYSQEMFYDYHKNLFMQRQDEYEDKNLLAKEAEETEKSLRNNPYISLTFGNFKYEAIFGEPLGY